MCRRRDKQLVVRERKHGCYQKRRACGHALIFVHAHVNVDQKPFCLFLFPAHSMQHFTLLVLGLLLGAYNLYFPKQTPHLYFFLLFICLVTAHQASLAGSFFVLFQTRNTAVTRANRRCDWKLYRIFAICVGLVPRGEAVNCIDFKNIYLFIEVVYQSKRGPKLIESKLPLTVYRSTS